MTVFVATFMCAKRIRPMTQVRTARFGLGQKVRHVHHVFYGLVLDVDARYQGPIEDIGSINPEQPFYSVMVETEEGVAIAYAAEEALAVTEGVEPISEQEQCRLFTVGANGRHAPRLFALQ
ncbi:heat shock protein HspQ [Brevundimonas sp.]|uniref:heat shock protein HspQ n=1 Tax=Brevundimonas sp. TaxID=1871086 RepID=UPI002FCA14EF